MSRLLEEIAYVRAGDKGDNVSIGVLAKRPEFYETVLATVTPERLRDLFGNWLKGQAHVYPMPNIDGCLVLLEQGLGGGATCTLRFDQTAKSLGYAVLRLAVQEPLPE
ncbi:hypothetical protein LSG25_13110 [Paralcaligenes sp. KSB-10]|jgi:hypothetical protein|uniref:AtuA-related protein n=1 Tax=Paralcaligenes sp. KSB-10 TaxID=2901142 RepID=UPI001E4169C8|nr:hypothetical protein [Paralcaligenes sp. KSB-10]UHL63007.1 hypothetical protein LSG25_13110 [Paralcaligenes sp. KSB-10]